MPEPFLIEIPKEKLPSCDRIDLPPLDAAWLDLPALFVETVQALGKCNGKIAAFWIWYEAQQVELTQ